MADIFRGKLSVATCQSLLPVLAWHGWKIACDVTNCLYVWMGNNIYAAVNSVLSIYRYCMGSVDLW